MAISKANIGQALHSVADDHVTAVADDIFDENLNKYQSELNAEIGQGDGVYDISAANPTSGNPTPYASLSEALTAFTDNTKKKGGMEIKYLEGTGNNAKYVKYRLTSPTFSTNESDWVQAKIPIEDTNDADLEFVDDDGNVLARYKDGHHETKNWSSDKSQQNTGERDYNVFSTSSNYAIGDIVLKDGLLYKFTSEHEAGDWDDSEVVQTSIAEILDNKIPNIVIAETDSGDLEVSDSQANVVFQIANGHVRTKNFDSRYAAIRRYLDYSRRIPFTISCNVSNFLVSDFTSEDIGTVETLKIYADNCVLYLPSTYTVDGLPTKIIIFCKQGASTIELNEDSILSNVNTGRIFRYMLYLGYGILAADGVPNGWATELKLGERAVGNYVAVQSTIHAFNYIREHYNIDNERVFIFGYSQGGHYAQNVIDNSNIPIVAAAELSPVCSMRYHQWDLDAAGTIDSITYTKLARLNIARIFNFPAVSNNQELLALQYDASKTIGYDPWNRNVENMYEGFIQGTPYGNHLWKLPDDVNVDDITMKKYCKCPLKIWAAQDDSTLGADVMKVFIKAIKNSGQVADLQLYSSGGHSIPANQNPIGTFIENEETCELYPIAKDIAIWFYNFGGNSVL